MCFHKNNCPKLVLFYLRPLEIVDQDLEPSEKLGSQDPVMVRVAKTQCGSQKNTKSTKHVCLHTDQYKVMLHLPYVTVDTDL